jgi:hypothetical protein
MKKTLLTLSLSILSILSVSAQEAATTPANPNAGEFAFIEETHDYGTINQGADGSYEFKFKNVGKEPIIISKAVGSCGCTVPNWPKEPILPGASSAIKVTYDTKRVGAFTKTVTISSNAKTDTKMLTIKGTVKEVPVVETFPAKKIGEGTPFEK